MLISIIVFVNYLYYLFLLLKLLFTNSYIVRLEQYFIITIAFRILCC